MSYEKIDIKKGITLHYIPNHIFKTNLISIFLSTPLKRETATWNALLPAVLRRGTEKMKTQEEINRKLEEMYGAEYDGGIEKIGDNQLLKFYIEGINNQYLPGKEDILTQMAELLIQIVLEPLTEKNGFKEEYVESEKKNLKQMIESRIDDKEQYSLEKCIENMYPNQDYSVYKYGYIEDLEKINSQNLYEYYQNLLQKCKIDIFFSGEIPQEEVKNIVEENRAIQKLKEREANYVVNNEETAVKEKIENINMVKEKRDVSQGKLVIGLDIKENKKDSRFVASMYNTILGDGANSKMFQNVREKAHLAYSARSSYIRQKNNIYVRCGIDIGNYEKALETIKQQLEDMKKGNFTEQDLENAKKYMITAINFVENEQDTQIIYYIGQELSNFHVSFEDYKKKVQEVTKQQVEEMAKKIEINTIYFLTSNREGEQNAEN